MFSGRKGSIPLSTTHGPPHLIFFSIECYLGKHSSIKMNIVVYKNWSLSGFEYEFSTYSS